MANVLANRAGRLAASAEPALTVQQISLSNFRNFGNVRLGFGTTAPPQMVVLVGPNGAGKTNLLEGLSYLAPGRGLRGARLADVQNCDSNEGWAVAARINGRLGPVQLGSGLAAGPRLRRTARIDGEVAQPAALGAHLSVSWLTPHMDGLFRGGAGERMRFFDHIVGAIHADHARRLNRYDKVHGERMALLTDQSGPLDVEWVKSLEAILSELSVAIAAARIDVLAGLQRIIDAAPDNGFPKARLALQGELEEALMDSIALDVEDRFRARLGTKRIEEARAGRALIGIKRSDLVVHHADAGMPARLCSTGEQKALLLGLFLARSALERAECGASPVMLIDEVAAHLDDYSRQALFEALLSQPSQVWLTGTERNLFKPLAASATVIGIDKGAFIQPNQSNNQA